MGRNNNDNINTNNNFQNMRFNNNNNNNNFSNNAGDFNRTNSNSTTFSKYINANPDILENNFNLNSRPISNTTLQIKKIIS